MPRSALVLAALALLLGQQARFAQAGCSAVERLILNGFASVGISFSSSSFCNATTLNNYGLFGEEKCMALALVENKFSSFTATCSTDNPAPVSVDNKGNPIPAVSLSDQRPLPAGAFSNSATLSASEGATYYWHFRQLLSFEGWAPCMVNASTTNVPQPVPPKWTPYSIINLNEQAGQPSYPFVQIMVNPAGTLLSIIIRGTETEYEWDIDFSYSYAGVDLFNFPGNTHAGITHLANHFWAGGIMSSLQALVLPTTSTVTSVSVSGHSLGAGLATLVSYMVQSYVNQQVPVRKIKVDALLFAPPNVGDATFTAAFNKLVNARRFPFQFDIVPQVPCTPQMIACSNTPIQTNSTGVKTWSYSTIGGTVTMLATNMPFQPNAWAKLTSVPVCDLQPFLSATHVCSYLCYFSKYVPDTDNMCLLWSITNSTTNPTPATYCTHGRFYPATPKYP